MLTEAGPASPVPLNAAKTRPIWENRHADPTRELDVTATRETRLGINEQFSISNRRFRDLADSAAFESLAATFPEDKVPWLDRADVDESRLTREQLAWRRHGYVILRGLIPDNLLDEYLALRGKHNVVLGAFGNFSPYCSYDEISAICMYWPLVDLIASLFGALLAPHFNLSACVSTQRGWHQDDYLNPDDTYSWYAATWIAIDDVAEEAGPFEYIPSSHRLPCMRGSLVKELLEPEVRGLDGGKQGGHHWATFAEGFVNRVYDNLIDERRLRRLRFLAKRGDVMIWHGKLLHRGSIPLNPDMPRPALITHYSNPLTRRDIGSDIRAYTNGAPYWFFQRSAPCRTRRFLVGPRGTRKRLQCAPMRRNNPAFQAAGTVLAISGRKMAKWGPDVV